MKKSNFIANFGYIILFGFFGTIISFLTLSLLIIQCKELFLQAPFLSTKECLLLASVLCATDTVAALTILKEKSFPTLNSILFGEGVVNDAVSILLYRAVENLIKAEQTTHAMTSVTSEEIIMMLITFGYLSVCSISIGVFFGLLCAYIFKNLNLGSHPVREIFLVLLFAYLSYITSEMLSFSGIMTLFCCGFSMATYAFKNLSP